MAGDASATRAARGLLRDTNRALGGVGWRPVAFGAAAALVGLGVAWLAARLLAALLGHGSAGWSDLTAAATLALCGAGLALAQERASLAAGAAARARLRSAALAKLLEAGPEDDRPVGEKAALVVDRVEALDGYFSRWLPAARLALIAPGCVLVAAALADPWAALLLGVAGLLVPVTMALTGIGAAQASRRQFDQLGRLSGRFLDRMRGLSTLVLFGRERTEAAALGEAARELRARTLRVLRIAFLSTTALELLAAGALAGVAWHAVARGVADPTATLFVLLLVPAFFAPLRAFAGAYHERMAAQGAAAALAPLLARPAPSGLLLEAVPPSVVVTFTDVAWVPDPARDPALCGLSFRANAGETIVLTGPSGAGKSSALRLLAGFHRPTSGRIAINGQDVTLLRPAELRRLSAYVGQHPHLFRATLRDNIRLARPDADDAAVERAAAAARVAQFAAALPHGLDTLVGEGGFGLSGGQAQRVALARAFLRDVPLVLLDEPTAHLDPGTEAEVLDSLRRLCRGRTAIVASHAAAARIGLGRVVALEAGRVAAPALAARR